MTAEQVKRELVGYRLKLTALGDRYGAGERSSIATEAQVCADELTCLLDEAPIDARPAVDYLIDRFEALRTASAS